MILAIIYGLIGAALAGFVGFKIAVKFWSTDYSKHDTSGDFGTPRGGFFSVMLPGMLIGWVFMTIGKLFLVGDTGLFIFLACIVVGAVGGFTGMSRARKNTSSHHTTDNKSDDQSH